MCILEMKSVVLLIIAVGLIDFVRDALKLVPSQMKEPVIDNLPFDQYDQI
jgi:hypothetical protein